MVSEVRGPAKPVQFYHLLVSNLDRALNRNHRQTYVIIMDFAKAFNNVRDMMLVYKLDYYGSRGPTHKWITSWLSERSQLSESGVGLSSLRSSPGPILCPQRIGFRAGPVFSFPENIRSFVRLLADDCDFAR